MVGTKACSREEYSHDSGNNWDEGVLQGNGGGNRSDAHMQVDAPTGTVGNWWGAPYAGGAMFAFADGGVRSLTYSFSINANNNNTTGGSINPFAQLLHPSDGQVVNLP